mgnify:CR=1 FL=1
MNDMILESCLTQAEDISVLRLRNTFEKIDRKKGYIKILMSLINYTCIEFYYTLPYFK